MNRLFSRLLRVASVLAVCCCGWIPPIAAQVAVLADSNNSATKQTTKEDGWIVEQDEKTGIVIRTRELILYPKAAPRPALKYRLIPDDFDMLRGNAAIYYLKAMGFFEQSLARERLRQIDKEASARAEKEGKEYSDVPPAVWWSTPPMELPLDKVEEYLQMTSFQPRSIREAAKRDRYDMDRELHEIDDPIGYLLPEIQSIRQLARTQKLRCRIAIAEDRIDDAIAITGQQFDYQFLGTRAILNGH
jgi:hypothetical protein